MKLQRDADDRGDNLIPVIALLEELLKILSDARVSKMCKAETISLQLNQLKASAKPYLPKDLKPDLSALTASLPESHWYFM